MGNICRSPAADNVMQHLMKQEKLESDFTIDSAGTIGYHVGEPPDERMSEAGSRRGIPFNGRSRKFVVEDFDRFDHILAMDNNNLRDILALARNSDDEAKVQRFCDFVENHGDLEVPDPYYGGHSGFEHVMDLVEDGCKNLLKHWQK